MTEQTQAMTRDQRLNALNDARLYLCTDARSGPDELRQLVRSAYEGGVDIIQLRAKHSEASDELAAIAIVREEAARTGKLFSANDRADIARLSGADVLHVGQRDLTPPQIRGLGLSHIVVGLSSHDEEQMRAAAANPEVDYFCTGPIWATPTKPGRAAVGLDLVRAAAATGTSKPWFAIGGVDQTTIDEVVEAGASRVVVVRAITEADDPRRAAQALRNRLP